MPYWRSLALRPSDPCNSAVRRIKKLLLWWHFNPFLILEDLLFYHNSLSDANLIIFPFLTFKIWHLVQKLAFSSILFMFSNSRVVLDGPCDDDYDNLWASLNTVTRVEMKRFVSDCKIWWRTDEEAFGILGGSMKSFCFGGLLAEFLPCSCLFLC